MAGEAERLQADNVALYEKVKFLESFDSSNSALAASGGGSDGYGSRKVPAGFEADTYPSSSSSSSSSPGKRRGGGGGATPSSPGGGAGGGSFDIEAPRPSSGGGSLAKAQSSGGGGGGRRSNYNDVESRYKNLYEEKLNPFNAFARQERSARYSQLNLADKVTLTSSKILLSTKHTRYFLFGYTLLLHLVVFGMMTHHTHTEKCAVLSKKDMAIAHAEIVSESGGAAAGAKGLPSELTGHGGK